MLTYNLWYLNSMQTVPAYYWNVKSAEERVKKMAKHINALEGYVNYISEVNTAQDVKIKELEERIKALEGGA